MLFRFHDLYNRNIQRAVRTEGDMTALQTEEDYGVEDTFDPQLTIGLHSKDPYVESVIMQMQRTRNQGRSSLDVVWVCFVILGLDCIAQFIVKNQPIEGMNRLLIILLFIFPLALLQTFFVKIKGTTLPFVWVRDVLFIVCNAAPGHFLDLVVTRTPYVLSLFSRHMGIEILTYIPLTAYPGETYRYEANVYLIRYTFGYLVCRPTLPVLIGGALLEAFALVATTGLERGSLGAGEAYRFVILSAVLYVIERNFLLESLKLKMASKRISDLLNHQRALGDRVQKATDSKSRFFSYIFHEVRLPLHSLSMGVDILLNSMAENSMELFETMRLQVDQATRVLNDVLLMRKLEEGSFSIVPVWFEFPPFLSRVLNMFQSQAIVEGIDLELEISDDFDDSVLYHGDLSRLQQVLSNLLANAIKYTGDNGRVCLYLKPGRDNDIIFGVEDTGTGIPEADHASLFQPYKQVSARSAEGTGLGLKLSQNMIELHQGTLKFTSIEGKGSNFYATVPFKTCARSDDITPVSCPVTPSASINSRLNSDSSTSPRDSPLLRDSGPGTPVAEESKPVISPRHFFSRKSHRSTPRSNVVPRSISKGTILVVEDSSPSRKLLSRILTKLNYDVLQAVDGAEAVALFNDQLVIDKVDIIFMDYHMPNLMGDEATIQIRSKGYNGIIIALTGNAGQAYKDLFLEAGADYFLTKPASIADIRQTLSDIETNEN